MCAVCAVCERVFNLSLCLFGFIERSYCLAIVGVTPTPTSLPLLRSLSLLACEHVSMAWHRCLDLGTWAQGSDQWAVVLRLSLSLSLGSTIVGHATKLHCDWLLPVACQATLPLLLLQLSLMLLLLLL